MSSETSNQLNKELKWAGIAVISMGVNHLIKKILNGKVTKRPHHHFQDENISELPSLKNIASQQHVKEDNQNNRQMWGHINLDKIQPQDGLLQEIQLMTRIVCPFQKVSNLIVDLELFNPKTFPCPLVAFKPKTKKEEPFLSPESLILPGAFVIENCVFRAGQSIQTQKKFMKAGPRSTQYFDPSEVKADIVCSGKMTPGINNVIRELVVLLKQTYKVEKVTGIKFSWRGYYHNDMVDLSPNKVQRLHHKGGCYLGMAQCECNAKLVVDNLQRRGVNQLYLIGGNNTISNATEIYKQIKKRRLPIAICVCLKAINKDIAHFDTCFGFQSAAEQTQRFIQEGYALSSSNYNSVALVKVPGRFSGFLAVDAVRAARNVNICLVPQFKIDLYGQKGLLQHIANRIQAKGHCILVYSDGASYSFNDIPQQKYRNLLLQKQTTSQFIFDLFLQDEIKKTLEQRNLRPHNVFFFNTQNAVRTVPANAFDTKLCSQIALCSIQGLMCGYTNFVIGHFKNRVAMVPLNQMTSFSDRFCLKVEDENWQRLLATTNQPPFINDHHP